MFRNRFVTITAVFVVAITGTVNADGEDAPVQAVPVEVFPLPANTVFERHVVGEGGSAATAERLIYSNTLGTFGAALGANRLVSDDITTTVPNNCKLRRFEFPVVGKVNPAGIGGPYTVDFAIYSNCPNSVPSASRPGLIVPGTQGQKVFTGADADVPGIISFIAAADVPIPTNFWFGVKFSRNNAGVVVGTPPTTGFSCDQFDYPGFPCNTNVGGFPGQPQASFNLEIFADSECANSFTGYKNNMPSGSIFNPGAGKTLADDIQLGVNECQMIAYEVAAKGVGFYTFDLRDRCDGGVISGTEKTFDNGSGTDVRIARFAFDPPIPLPPDLWFSAKVNNSTGGVVIAGRQACIGATTYLLETVVDNTCVIVPPSDLGFVHGAVNLAVTCAGAAPVGACCDMIIPQCDGGPDDGRPCCPADTAHPPFCAVDPGFDAYPPCTPPGTCELACREVPQVNCPWPQRFTTDQPTWIEGASCEPDPFPLPCGVAACCRPDQVCENLTLNECYAIPPIDGPRQWKKGLYCEDVADECVPPACLRREGDCVVTHQEPGCDDPFCCTQVCEIDNYCCNVEWDRNCVEHATVLCPEYANHDECYSTNPRRSALLVEADSSTFFANTYATENDGDPGFCCRGDAPGDRGFGTVWFKFVATDTSARVSTCNSAPANDSLLQVFAAGDPSTEETACASLAMIACSDDVEECGGGTHGKICVQGLTPGDTYYVMLAAKTRETKGLYELEIRSPCFQEPIWNPNDCNENKLPDGCELGRGTATDCNGNHLLDECDITLGTSFDCDANAILDECDGLIETLTPTPSLPGGAFGTSVVMDGPWLVVGSGFEFTGELRARYPLHIYRRTPVGWKIAQTIDLPVPPTYVGMDDGWIAVTSDVDDVAYLLRLDGDLWVDMGTLQGPAIGPCARYGYPLAIDGDTIALATGYCQGGRAGPEEVVFVFRRDGLNWVKEAQLMPPPGGGLYSLFGASVALAGDRLIVGVPDSDSAHVFRRENESWAFETTLHPPDEKLLPPEYFGRSAAFDGRTAVVGATLASSEEIYAMGAAYVFAFDGTAWSYEAKLLASDAAFDFARFGWSVGIAGNTAVIGVPFANAAYTFHRQGTQWIEQAELSPPPGKNVAYFGYGVATDGALVAVGAPGFDSATLTDSGIVYVFQPPKADCNENDVPDLCDVRDASSADCNHDDVPDDCTSTDGTTPDCDDNGVPDDCETLPPFDSDFDTDVDLIDLAGLQRCFTGPGPTAVAPCCRMFDSEPDGDVDGADFVAFRGVFKGP